MTLPQTGPVQPLTIPASPRVGNLVSVALGETPLPARARELEAAGQTDAALDLIYDEIDELLRNGRFEDCNRLLETCRISECSLDVLVSLLTATAPAKTKLPGRKAFFEAVKNHVHDCGDYQAGLLEGLES